MNRNVCDSWSSWCTRARSRNIIQYIELFFCYIDSLFVIKLEFSEKTFSEVHVDHSSLNEVTVWSVETETGFF